MEAWWYVLALGVYAAAGVFVLGTLSKKYPGLWPLGEGGFVGVTGLEVVEVLFAAGWILTWPLHVAVLPWTKKTMMAPRRSRGKRDDQGLWVPVGAQGVSATELQPVGRIDIDGKEYEARAQHGFIAAGQAVEVIGRLKKCLVVLASGEADTRGRASRVVRSQAEPGNE